MKKVILIISLLCFAFVQLRANENSVLFEKGNLAFTSKYYQQAIECYEKIISNGFESSELYYNLGSAYFRQEDYPSSILYFEKAKKLDPGDEDIIHNLKMANTKILDKIEKIPDFFLIHWWKTLINIFSFNTWAITGIAFMMFALSFFGFYLFSTILRRRKLAFWTSLIIFLFMILSFLSAQSQYSSATSAKNAIIFTPSVTVKSSPDINSTDLFVIHEGTKVRVTDNIGDWSEIKIANGSVGWVNTSVFKTI
ncbi:MAG: tetratricopeptide repeat protein [Bacteroidota bacterium]